MSESNSIARTHYFAGEALLTDDFRVEQDYHMAMLRHHNRSLHTYGIARGLEVTHDSLADANQIEIAPGSAIDRLGREIILLEPVVLRMVDPQPGANYYLSISYDEVYGDYSDASGVAGYKRIIQQPTIAYGLNLSDPGLHLLLAVIGFSSQGAINSLTYKSGSFERRYVGSVLGTVSFVTEGSGVRLDAQTDALAQLSSDGLLSVGSQAERGGYASISARRDNTAPASEARDYLLIDAPRTQFSGLATTRGNLGIGNDQPLANLQIDALRFSGPGTLTSNGSQVQLSEAPQPFFQVGDMLVSDPSVTHKQQQRTIVALNAEHGQVTVDQAFAPPLTQAGYSYIRARLATFASPQAGEIFEARYDGTLGLGRRYAVQGGEPDNGCSALLVSPDRKVGIALASGTPQAELDVNGALRANSAAIAGKVVAGSFEGNGSKLVGLPILSFWTQESPGDPNSKLHYLPGNVGIRTSNPPGSLGVGGGHSQIGAGLISTTKKEIVDGVTEVTLTGYQTQLQKEVGLGDTITIGDIIETAINIAQIGSDTSLTLEVQPPIVLHESSYSFQAPQGKPQPGTGTVSSDGRQISGTGTQFLSTLKPGYQLLLPEFKPAGAKPETWFVKAVDPEKQQMTLVAPSGGADSFEANNSAFLISQALLAQFKADPPPNGDAPVPALLITTNGRAPAPNTVAINVPLDSVDTGYALQVNGDVNFTGGGGGGTLTVQTLLATRDIRVQGDTRAELLLQVAEAGASAPVLGVTAHNVVLGQAKGDAQYILDAKGGMHASANIVSDQTVQAATLSGSALKVSGSQILANGSVQMIGTRSRAYTQADMTNGGTTFSAVAPTDGFVLATVGLVSDKFAFFGYLEGASSSNGSTTSYAYAAAVCYPFSAGEDKKGGGGTTYYPTVPGSFTLPVRAGETWTLTRSWLPSGSGLRAPSVEFYWVPLGTAQGQASDTQLSIAADMGPDAAPETEPKTEPDTTSASVQLSPGQAAMAALRSSFEAGGFARENIEAAQRAIDERVGDLVKVFGDATQMSAEPQDRAAFLEDLRHIVCSATPPGQPAEASDKAQRIQELIDTFGRVTGRDFSGDQRALLARGVQALVQINDSEQNRHDLVLIKNNIGFFLDNMAQVLGSDFSVNERRLLTRALVRLVGDGSQHLPGATPPAAFSSGASLPWPGVPARDAPQSQAAQASFLAAIEHALGAPLDPQGLERLQQSIAHVVSERPTQAEASARLRQDVAGIAGQPLSEAATAALGAAIDQLLAALP